MKKKRQEMQEAPKKGRRATRRRGRRSSRADRQNKQKMIDAFDTYIKYVPDSPELPNIKYRKARIYYEANHFDEALPLFKDIADHHQDSELALYSANLLLDCLSFKKKYDDAAGDRSISTARCYEDEGRDGQGAVRDLLKSQLGRKRIEIAEKEGQLQGRGASCT